MSRYIVTECPACTTRFQVTAGQLKLAGGKVRCGACLEVFNAEVYRCDNVSDPLEEIGRKDVQDQETHKDPLFEAVDIPSFISHPSQTETTETTDEVIPDQAPDELLAEQLNSSPDPEFDNSELEQPVQSIVKEEENLSPEPAIEEQPREPSSEENSKRQSDTKTWIDPLAESVAETLQQTPSNDQKSEVTATVPDPEQTRPFTAIRAEPVMIRGTQTQSSMNLSGLMLVLLAIILFCGQFLWFNRQTLSAAPQLTQLYQQACQHLPCNLLPVIDLRQIDTRQLVIQESEQYQGVLSVSMLIENIAPAGQPYPAVRLSFTDRKGKLLSQRLFQPEEYLNNRQLDLQRMPAQQTVQISFDILDPGRRAVSYEARLEAPRIAAEASDQTLPDMLFSQFL